jgi:hypothetical protein
MSTTTVRPLVPLPLSDDTDALDTDTSVSRRGYGAWFCGRGHDDDRAPMTVEDHGGPWCESLGIGYVDGYTDDGRVMPLGLHLVRPFLHGTYMREDVYMRGELHDTRLMFVVNATSDHHDERVEVILSAGDVRRLAASLLYAADHIDGLARPMKMQTNGL